MRVQRERGVLKRVIHDECSAPHAAAARGGCLRSRFSRPRAPQTMLSARALQRRALRASPRGAARARVTRWHTHGCASEEHSGSYRLASEGGAGEPSLPLGCTGTDIRLTLPVPPRGRAPAGAAGARGVWRSAGGVWPAMAPLHTASKKGDLDGVRAALAAGADVNGKDSVRGVAALRTSAHAGMRAARSARGCAREAACAALGAAGFAWGGAKRRHAWPQASRAAHARAAASRCACRGPVRLAGRGALVCVGCGARAVRLAPSLAEPRPPQPCALFRCAAPRQGGNTALIWATYAGNLEVLSLLLQRGADTAVPYKQARARAPRLRRVHSSAVRTRRAAPARTRPKLRRRSAPSLTVPAHFDRARGGRACTSRRARTRPRLHAC
jgi:hypothetical protein